MARRTPISEDQITKWYEEGLGSGSRDSYKPWLTVRRFSSYGLSSRVKSLLCNRIHHTFSMLERQVLLLLEDLPNVWDIREQYPLDRARTLVIADNLGIRHPYYPGTGVPTVMTTDFLVTFKRGCRQWDVAIAVKYMKDSIRPRVRNKLAIERDYWHSMPTAVRHVILTEEKASLPYVGNLEIIRPYRRLESLYPLSAREVRRIARLLRPGVLRRKTSLVKLCTVLDHNLGYRVGTCLKVSRHLIANREWPVDLHKPYNPRRPLSLTHAVDTPLASYVTAA